jgi:hypothetical protein
MVIVCFLLVKKRAVKPPVFSDGAKPATKRCLIDSGKSASLFTVLVE